MTGGLDILIVGIAGENLDYVAPGEKLQDLFNESSNTNAANEQFVDDFHALAKDPTIANPRIFYLAGEHLCGAQMGAGLGYVIFDGNLNAQPKRLDERTYERIDELKQRFIAEVEAKGLKVPINQVGIYALNVSDT